MAAHDDGRGILYPAALPSFHRVAPPVELRESVRWFWVPRWDLPPGRTSRQTLLPFPAANLVVEPSGVVLAGPTTGLSHRDLRGTGWAVGALLRPAGAAGLPFALHTIRDVEVTVDAPELHRAVVHEMGRREEEVGRDRAVLELGAWVARSLGSPDDGALLANAMEDLISTDREIVRVEQVAARLGVSVRGVQRLARRYIGLAPLAVIRRYRLQEAAQLLREDPSRSIAQTAADLGYADHAHLSADFRRVLGVSPSAYRRDPDDAP